jgi:hypothetical protein
MLPCTLARIEDLALGDLAKVDSACGVLPPAASDGACTA